jgi:hypothetical protein
LNGCVGPWWDMSRRALNFMEDILNTYCRHTFSAITHKWNVFGYMFCYGHISCFGMWNSCLKFRRTRQL